MSAEEQSPTTKTLYGLDHFSARLVLIILASVADFTSWRMTDAELYAYARPPTETRKTGRTASGGDRAQRVDQHGFRRSSRKTVREWST